MMTRPRKFFVHLGKHDYNLRWGLVIGWGRNNIELDGGYMMQPWKHAVWIDVDLLEVENAWRSFKRALTRLIRIGGY